MKELKGYRVFEISFGGSHSVSKVFPTLLGCKRVLNRFCRDNIDLVGYSYIIKAV